MDSDDPMMEVSKLYKTDQLLIMIMMDLLPVNLIIVIVSIIHG